MNLEVTHSRDYGESFCAYLLAREKQVEPLDTLPCNLTPIWIVAVHDEVGLVVAILVECFGTR